MANKQINELGSIIPSGGVEGDYLLPVYNTNSIKNEKVEKATVSEVRIPKWNPFTGTRPKPSVLLHGNLCSNLVNIGAPEGEQFVSVTAADAIISIIHNDKPPYEYGIWLNGNPAWLDPQADPRDAVLNLDCTFEGTQFVDVGVRDSEGSYTVMTTPLEVENTDSLACGP